MHHSNSHLAQCVADTNVIVLPFHSNGITRYWNFKTHSGNPSGSGQSHFATMHCRRSTYLIRILTTYTAQTTSRYWWNSNLPSLPTGSRSSAAASLHLFCYPHCWVDHHYLEVWNAHTHQRWLILLVPWSQGGLNVLVFPLHQPLSVSKR